MIYACLNELSPKAEESRSRGDLRVDVKKLIWVPEWNGSGDEPDIPMHRQGIASRQKLQSVAKTARKLSELIREYHDELGWSALAGDLPKADAPRIDVEHAKVIDLHRDVTSITEDPWEALDILRNSLRWIAALAEFYSAPLETTLFKSKGLLFLVQYVELVTEEGKLGNRAKTAMHSAMADLADHVMAKDEDDEKEETKRPQKRKGRNKQSDKQKEKKNEKEKHWSPSDLRAKLHRLEMRFPRGEEECCEERFSRLTNSTLRSSLLHPL